MALFNGKVALVTGESSGIGRATAIAFAREGAKVVVASRREAEGLETVQLVKESPKRWFLCQNRCGKGSRSKGNG